jgi:long-chain acyl-CoA synthetase
MNLGSIARDGAERFPQREAVRLGTRVLSYADLNEQTARLAAFLGERGVRPGDRVGVLLPNVVEFPLAYFAILRAGGIVVPMNVLLKRREISFYLADSGAEVLLAWHGFEAEARAATEEARAELITVDPAGLADSLAGVAPRPEVAEVGDNDTAVILYTSGTTGKPKGAELTHRSVMRNSEVVAMTATDVREGDVILGALPLFHIFGQTVGMNASLRAGATLVLLPKFDPEATLAAIEANQMTHFYGVPTMFGALLHHPGRERYDTSSLRICVTGGASMPVEVLHGFERAFSCEVLEGYGLSETSPVVTTNHAGRERRAGSVGTPIDGVEVRVVDDAGRPLPVGEVGEIVVRGHNVMKGYWKRPEATAEAIRDGWFHTGDLGRTDQDGYFYIVDRKKDMIIRGGYNVYPREVEEVLYEHPQIREAAVIGMPDERWGEEIGAAVVLHEGERLEAQEVSDYVKERIAAYKYPRIVWFVDELPKGPTGKILKREIARPSSAARMAEPARQNAR